ncbi:MAG: adenylate/guanylate cyclase domain-containing protein [Betaproteobacteria bacterium]|nr:adenylate/guanylate cyclase domain-containing protein [Betaproteobacteria bacterium]
MALENEPYIVLYSALTDKTGNSVGRIIFPRNVSKEMRVLEDELIFALSLAAASFAIFLALSGWYFSRQEKERRSLKQAFQKYLSPKILEAILSEPGKVSLGGQRREVTILFADIRSFTTLAEKLPPQTLTQLLQEYFEAMTEEVLREDGIVDKYIGDAIMAFWGAPIDQKDQADRAVRAACAMMGRLRALQDTWRAASHPVFDIGIGINLGIATVGNMGSSKRFDYTVIGDAVNAAARLEQLNKDHSSHIIISESTKKQLTIQVNARDLGDVRVKGKDESIRIFEILTG